MALTRHAATDVSAWSIGGTSFLTALHNATIKFDAKTEDASGVADLWQYAFPTKYDADLDADMYIENSSLAAEIGQTVQLQYTVGPNSYSGPFVISSVNHTAPHGGIQMSKLTFKTQGTPTVV